MKFLDDSLLPENQEKLVIQVAPFGPQSRSACCSARGSPAPRARSSPM